MAKNPMNDLLSNPASLTNSIEYLSDAVEFEYPEMVIRYERGEWVVAHEDEESHPDEIVIHSPTREIEFPKEGLHLFGERKLTLEEFNLLKERATNIVSV